MDLGHNGDLSSVYNKALRLFSVESHESLCPQDEMEHTAEENVSSPTKISTWRSLLGSEKQQ